MNAVTPSPDIASLLPRSDFTRRDFIGATLAVGFALAVRPPGAETITTDGEGLEAGEVRIPVADGEIPGYRAMPARGGPFATVLVVQEIFGVHEHIRDVCRRLAKRGYFAVAPELFVRQGDVAGLGDIQTIISTVVSKVPDSQVLSDLDATAAWAGATGSADIQRLGITGFCWGGRIVWLYAAQNPALKAGVAWYGRLVGEATPLQPRHPIDVADRITAPVLGLYGAADQGIPLQTVEQMRGALQASTAGCEIVVYPDTPHGFHADYRASFRPRQAADAWRRLLEWFAAHGVAS